MAAKVALDVCTPQGSTWLAQLTGLDDYRDHADCGVHLDQEIKGPHWDAER